MRSRLAIAAFLAVIAAGMIAPAAFAVTSATTTSSESATRTYDFDFTLPTAGKSGCQVCHGDKNLVKPSGDSTVSLYVDQAELDASAHVNTVCSGCHVDFAYETPHENVASGDDWRATAKLACKNCKQHQPQFTDYASGAHSPAPRPGETESQTVAGRQAEGKPLYVPYCGDCHGSHAIPSKNDTEARLAYQDQGIKVCGGCHTKQSDSYADYYHGAAYREGAPDAPACWDCHGTHEILPAADKRSMVNEQHIVETCGQEGCHINVLEQQTQFIEYAAFIHGRKDEMQDNPLVAFYQSALETVSSWFN